MIIQLTLTYEQEQAIVAMLLQGIGNHIQPAGSMMVDYLPTKRLTVKEACQHLRVSRSTLDARCRNGEIRKRFSASNKPYFLLGELDGMEMPVLEPRKMGKKRGG